MQQVANPQNSSASLAANPKGKAVWCQRPASAQSQRPAFAPFRRTL